jgi:hypothetical protein
MARSDTLAIGYWLLAIPGELQASLGIFVSIRVHSRLLLLFLGHADFSKS